MLDTELEAEVSKDFAIVLALPVVASDLLQGAKGN